MQLVTNKCSCSVCSFCCGSFSCSFSISSLWQFIHLLVIQLGYHYSMLAGTLPTMYILYVCIINQCCFFYITLCCWNGSVRRLQVLIKIPWFKPNLGIFSLSPFSPPLSTSFLFFLSCFLSSPIIMFSLSNIFTPLLLLLYSITASLIYTRSLKQHPQYYNVGVTKISSLFQFSGVKNTNRNL